MFVCQKYCQKVYRPFSQGFLGAIHLELSSINDDQAIPGSKIELRLSSAPAYYDKYPIINRRICRKYVFLPLHPPLHSYKCPVSTFLLPLYSNVIHRLKYGGWPGREGNAFIAKLSPSFRFSWAELVFNLNFAPPNHPSTQGKYQYGQIQPDLVKQSWSPYWVDPISSNCLL